LGDDERTTFLEIYSIVAGIMTIHRPPGSHEESVVPGVTERVQAEKAKNALKMGQIFTEILGLMCP
jgi:hypothetical protein